MVPADELVQMVAGDADTPRSVLMQGVYRLLVLRQTAAFYIFLEQVGIDSKITQSLCRQEIRVPFVGTFGGGIFGRVPESP